MFWVGRDLKDHLVPTPLHGQGHLPLHHFAQRPIQPDLEHFQGGTIHNFSGQPVPVPHTLIAKKFFHLSNLNVPSFSVKPLALVLSLNAL